MIPGFLSKWRLSKGSIVAIATIVVCLLQVKLNYNLVLVDKSGNRDGSLHHQKIPQRDPNSLPHDAPPHPIEGTNHLRKLLLSVPFYVYEELAWINATLDGKPIQEFVHGSQQKHTDDYWFMKSALEHPLRTRNASLAKLFVIPSLHNLLDSRAFFKSRDLCVQSRCNNKLMKLAGKIVTSSPHFQAHPKAHLAVVSHFAHHKSWWTRGMPPLYLRMLQESSNIHFEDFPTNHPGGWSVPKLHVGRPCPWQGQDKTQDVTLIASFKPNDDRFQDRETICTWLQTAGSVSSIRMEQCGPGPMCPALANAKLGFHVRGDTPSASRLFDTILSGTVPIFTNIKQYQVLPEWIDWKAISYFVNVNESNAKAFVQQVRDILDDVPTYQQKLKVLLANRHWVDWTGLYPFDMYMYMLQAHLYPETRHDPATFFAPEPWKSILHLPPLVPS